MTTSENPAIGRILQKETDGRSILVIDGIVSPEEIIAKLQRLEHKNPNAGKMREVIQEEKEMLVDLLEQGGVISANGEHLYSMSHRGFHI